MFQRREAKSTRPRGALLGIFFPARNGLKHVQLVDLSGITIALCRPAGRLERLHHKRSHNRADHAFPRREHDYTSALLGGKRDRIPTPRLRSGCSVKVAIHFHASWPALPRTLLNLSYSSHMFTLDSSNLFPKVILTHNHRINARVNPISNCRDNGILRYWIWSQAA